MKVFSNIFLVTLAAILIHFSLSNCIYGQVVKVMPVKIGGKNESVFASYYIDGTLYYCSDKLIKTKTKTINEGASKSNFLNLYQINIPFGIQPSQKPLLLSDSINSLFNEGPLVFSQNKTTVFFSSNIFNNSNDSTLRLGLFSAQYDGQHFNHRKPIKELRISNANMAHPALYQDDNMLIFVSDKEGGEGKSDLYYSFKEQETWSEPININVLNTEYNETFPTVFNNRLYFASDRPGGFGGLDIYVSSFVNGKWIDPELMPAPINGPSDDFLLVPVDGKRGYFSSNRVNETDKIFFYTFQIPSVENFIQQELDTCFTFVEQHIENRNELEYTWYVSDGAVYKSNEMSHCFSGIGKYTVWCDIYETAMNQNHPKVATIDVEITYDLPLIEYRVIENYVHLTCNQKHSGIKYKYWYWRVNGINYLESSPDIKIIQQMDVKLILWNDKDAIGIQKSYSFN